MEGVLAKIVDKKRLEVAEMMTQRPLEQFIDQVSATERHFLAVLQQPGARFILECKKASPSKGLIREHFDLNEISSVYNCYADGISVLTDTSFFQGSYQYLRQMRSLTDKPLLHKDFIISSYQIYAGREAGADAVLLMLSILDDTQYRELATVAKQLHMTILTEVSNEQETLRAVTLGAELIGINNRNLRDLSTDLQTSVRLRQLIPADRTVVSESGIYQNQQVRQLLTVADAFLVGSSLMAQADLAGACHRLIIGEHKVCGLTRAEDVQAVYQAGGYYGGLIFAAASPRAVSAEQAAELVKAAPLRFVGVFVNAEKEQVARLASQLALAAVQLHGDEDDAYLQALKPLLPTGCEIWKAYRVQAELPAFTALADRILLDSFHPQQHGGSGVSFDWRLLQQLQSQQPIMLAGGLNPDNLSAALALPVAGLDMNSGLETAAGLKDTTKIASAFQRIREFDFLTKKSVPHE
ncbi:bifunctional indole-3-glycerol-phosphate synthase TrpC/phosphoribosylanthranilate isomerase TrpF [Alishewanella sp. 16-MA]|uniref:Multifunctional fusion protein n=1 Tax=Alishewanella maricola TaxID=2795740 RepID=A0ABS8C1C4_9ALTE|nr:bifunctional indole-3-glycerol-phosphate synthase TrpC/phosphoribosylanthranilate isomerase TrpF [Alishewanella maricola]